MGRAPCCDKANVKKGPWSPEEDARLKSYIQQHGTGGNWIALPHKIGLRRCGKSCRLRWLNYLRPNIKHGGFSEEEDNIICSLYITIGSRWSVIAAQLPGRTDNDIKNYWNTRLKKKLLGKQRKDHHHQRASARSNRTLNHPSTATTTDNHNHNSNPLQPMVLEFPPPGHDPMTMMMMMKMMDHDQQSIIAAQHWQLPAGTAMPLPAQLAAHHEEFNVGEMLVKLHGQNHGYNDQVYSAAMAIVSPNSSVSIESSSTGAIPNPSASPPSSSLLFPAAGLQETNNAPFPVGLSQADGDHDQLLLINSLDGFEGWYDYQIGGNGASSSESTAATTTSTTWGNASNYENSNIISEFNKVVMSSDLPLSDHHHQLGSDMERGLFHQLPPMEDSSIYFSPPQ